MDIKLEFKNNDSLEELKRIKGKKFKTIFLDPPYFRVVNEDWDKEWRSIDEYIEWTELYVKELSRISKPASTVWLCGFAYQITRLIPIFENHGFKFKQFIVIDKGLRSIAGRSSDKLKQFPTATEYIAFFYKDTKHLIRDELQKHAKENSKTAKEINKYLGKATNGGGTWSSIAGIKQSNLQFPTKKDWDLLKKIFPKFKWKYNDYVYTFNSINGFTDVWSDIDFYIKGRIHPTEKPEALLERIILTSTNKGDWILDPFAGSGSTGRVARKLDRNSFLIEKDTGIYKKSRDNLYG